MSPRTIFSPYVRLFAVPGSSAFSFAGWLARLPMPILGLGAVLLVEGETGSYGLAGAVAGTLAMAMSLASPQWARVMDRRGQSGVLQVAFAGYLVFGIAFVAAVSVGAPQWSWFVFAGLTGASGPNVGSVVRARWAGALDPDSRQTAFAFESVVDEVVFVIGPPLVTLLATLINPPVGFLTGVVIGFCGGIWLSRLRDTEPPVEPVEVDAPRRRPVLRNVTVLLVAIVYLAVGCVFGAMDVVVVAYAEAEGAPALAGLALAVYAFGSLVAGLAYGVVHLPGSLGARFIGCAVFFAVAAQLLFAVDSLVSLVPVGFVAGLAIAPVLVAGTSLVESRVPRSALTEALTWVVTGVTVGVTMGSAVAGAAVDAWGAETAFAVPAVAAAVAGVLALAGGRLLRGPAVPSVELPQEGARVADRKAG
ncbi:MFS transporter [Blastococcus sp. CT_GayMR20]|uniref:MFS transporter n=1 Tax=Blastococcus sp. CT_GayMR20 TaxID=2559609 RepID=UPI0010741AE9|nr:MFS transporter [Blastococcus sp. CT_GayMR20]TFV88060.1 MFS transporter [Blastococcus sp. CT_GayMR20]